MKIFSSTGQSGNAIVMLFAAIGVAGLLTYGLNNIVRGPAVTTAELSRKTIAENNLVASTRLAVAAATRSQANNGDCDGDGFVEPLPYRDAGALPKPTGGGLLPATMGGSLTDPWGNQYGYCVWDSGTASVSDNIAACGGSGALRLQGAPREDQPILAVISAGKDGTFQTSCNAYVDTTPADGLPDTPMVNKPTTSDDVILSYTYAEANGIGSGEWKLDPLDNTTAQISKNLDIQGGGTFSGPVQLQNKGLVLPGDPGDDSVTGACDASKDQQMRRNISTSPPTLEICDFTNGGGWTSVSGGVSIATISGFNPGSHNCTANGSGPLAKITSHNNPGGTGLNVWSDGTYLYLADAAGGMNAYSFNGASLTLLDTATVGGVEFESVWGDGNYIYAITNDSKLRAYTFNGTSFSPVATQNLANNAYDVFVSGGYIYVADGASGALAFTFNGTAFAAAGSYTTSNATSLTSDGTYIFVGDSTDGIIALTHSGAAFTLAGSIAPATAVYDVWSDGVYLYAALTTGGIAAYDFNGTAFTNISSQYNGSPVDNLWGDGVNIFATTDAGLEVYTFNGSFSLVDSYSLGSITWSPWGDGSYIYVANEAQGLVAFNGYACLSVTAAGSSGGSGSSTQNTITDPLDAGLISHWKLDEGQGTVAADSVGDNDLLFDNTPTWADNGPTGTSSINFNRADNDGLYVDTLFGSPPQGTISLWVNSQSWDPGTNIATLIEVGSSVSITDTIAGPSLVWYDGSSWPYLVPNRLITGTGWHLITATFDDVNDVMRLYIDGTLAAESTTATTINYGSWGTRTTFGNKYGQTNRTMDGGLDDIRFYNRALSPREVMDLYKRSKINNKYPAIAQFSPRTILREGRLAVGFTARMAIKSDGSLWSWGEDASSVLGNGPAISGMVVTPTRVSDLGSYEYVSMSKYLACGIRTGGNLAYCWGSNSAGQTGIGSAGANVDQATTPISAGAGLTWTQLIAADTHAFGIKSDGTGWAWGDDSAGRLGNAATATPILIPESIAGGGTWRMISADSNVACGIKTDGTAWCWGNDTAGQLGNGTAITGSQSTPTQVDDSGPWVNISANDSHVCGIKSDGSMWCWGDDTNGMLGNGWVVTANQPSPYRVLVDGPWLKVSAGSNTTCALKADTTLWCWGLNSAGQLGDGTSTTRDTPWPVNAESGWVDIENSMHGPCALKNDGSLWCWGRDAEGELGNGALTTTAQTTPTRVENWINPWTWEWDDAGTNLLLNSAYNLAIGTAKFQPTATLNNIYFGFTAAGMAQSYSAGTTSHVKIETTAASTSSQLSFKTYDGGGAADITGTRVGYWPFDDVVGSTTAAATTGSAGTVNNGAAFTQSYGKIGGSAYFSPGDPTTANQYIRMANAAYLRPTSLTVSFWMKRSGKGPSAQSETLFEKTYNNHGSSPYRSYSAFITGNYLTWRTGRAGGWSDLKSSTEILNDQWYYITLVMAPSGAAPQKKIYINGVLDNSQTNTSAIAYDTTTTGDLFIGGCCSTAGNEGFYGEIDDFRIYNIGFGNPEALALYTYLSSQFQTPRSMGIESATYNWVIGKNNTAVTSWVDTIIPDLAINTSGRMGIGTTSPQAALDVNGGIKISEDYECSAAGQAGKIRYVSGNTPPWQYCNGTTWTNFSNAYGAYWKRGARTLSTAGACMCALQSDGTAWCWGNSNQFCLGNNDDVNDHATPVKVHTNSSSAGWSDWKKISVSMNPRGCGIRANGTAWCWGRGFPGVLGNGSTGDRSRPSQVKDDTGTTTWSDWIDISAGKNHTCGIRSNGTAWCWGDSTSGKLGNGTTTPDVYLPSQVLDDSGGSTYWSDWVKITASRNLNHTCGIRANGTAWCWGPAASGVLGNNSTTATQTRPGQVHSDVSSTGWTDWIDIDAGSSNTCGLRINGTVWCWGDQSSGAVGNNTSSSNALRPKQVKDDVGGTGWSDWIMVRHEGNHGCGIRKNGTAWCWGAGSNGKLGNNGTANALLPVQVLDSTGSGAWSDWISISPGLSSTCGVRVNGSLWCWGAASTGRLGDNQTTTDRLLPVQVYSP